MKDNFGRNISYLRISVTKRCNQNCIYCGKEECETPEKELTADEIYLLSKAFAACGIKKIRVTGGEPLLRKDICDIVAALRKIPGIEAISLTTNGVLLSRYADSLKRSGLDSVNVSLDSLDEFTYSQMTGTDNFNKVLEGIKAAQCAGLSPIKINAVLIRDVNGNEAEKLIMLAKDNEIDVRFIELMPFSDEVDYAEKIITGSELLKQFSYLKKLPEYEGTAKYYTADGFKGKIGLIDPISKKFCAECNRIRLLSDGKVKPCLGYDTAYDLLPYINDERQLIEQIKTIIKAKPLGHKFNSGNIPSNGLNKTGG